MVVSESSLKTPNISICVSLLLGAYVHLSLDLQVPPEMQQKCSRNGHIAADRQDRHGANRLGTFPNRRHNVHNGIDCYVLSDIMTNKLTSPPPSNFQRVIEGQDLVTRTTAGAQDDHKMRRIFKMRGCTRTSTDYPQRSDNVEAYLFLKFKISKLHRSEK